MTGSKPWEARAAALFPNGTTFHFIERANAIGPRGTLTGIILAERPDGSFRRLNGEELALLEEMHPGSVRNWVLPPESW